MGNPWDYDFSAIGARTAPLLVVTGSDIEGSAKNDGGGFTFGGNSDVFKLFPDDLKFDQVNLSRQFLAGSSRPDLSRYEAVLNLVTDPDQHPRTLETLRKKLRGYRGRVINHPEAVVRCSRDRVARLLTAIPGLRVPRVVRVRGGNSPAADTVVRAGLAFPLIVRQAGTHTGKIVGLFDDVEQLRWALAEKGEFFATEFVDLRDSEGVYRKYRVYFFGRRLVFRNLYLSDQWNVHSKDHRRFIADRPEVLKDLEAMFTRAEGNFPESMSAVFREVRKRMPLDFFGMDVGFDRDGQAVLFEANATMSIVPRWDDVQFKPFLRPARQAIRELLTAPAR